MTKTRFRAALPLAGILLAFVSASACKRQEKAADAGASAASPKAAAAAPAPAPAPADAPSAANSVEPSAPGTSEATEHQRE